MRITTRGTVYLAFFIALGVILTRFASIRLTVMGIESIRIGMSGFPLIFAGLLFGPVAGGIVGALTDIIGFFMSPMGGYMPHFTLTAALTGILPALFLKVSRRSEKAGFPALLLAILAGEIITALVLVPYFQHLLFGFPYRLIIPPRIVTVALEAPLYAGIAHSLLHRLEALVRRLRLSYR
ncbi:MAG: folate family ECF transporter S component [Firmicutes bacterium]|nr:folate family ECF transporter S component [Bacillota bacterium]